MRHNKKSWTKSNVNVLPPIETHQKVSYLIIFIRYFFRTRNKYENFFYTTFQNKLRLSRMFFIIQHIVINYYYNRRV